MSRSGESEAVKDLSLPVRGGSRRDHFSLGAAADQDAVDREGAEQGVGRAASFAQRFVVGHALPVESFQQLVRLQGDVQQTDQRFDAARRLQEDRPDRQRRLPLMVQPLDVILLLVLREQRVGAGGDRRRGDESRPAVVAVVEGVGVGIEGEGEPMRRPAKALSRRGHGGVFCGGQGDQFPLEIAGGVAFPQQVRDLTLDAGGGGRGVAAVQFGGEFFETGADFGDVIPASLAAFGGVGTTVGEEDAAENFFPPP